MADPLVWPCGSAGINGTRRLNCRAPCCVVPAMTLDGEDTPAWVARAALREEIEAGIAQPDFGAGPAHEKSPDKTIFTHDPASGMTPLGATDKQQATLRVELAHPGVPGHRFESPVNPATPAHRQE